MIKALDLEVGVKVKEREGKHEGGMSRAHVRIMTWNHVSGQHEKSKFTFFDLPLI